MESQNSKKIIAAVILIFLVASALLAYNYISVRKQLDQAEISLNNNTFNQKVLDFTKLFIEKVLKSNQEVDFNTRLKLENAVRDLGDDQILAQWQKFTDSKTDTEAVDNTKQLLEVLVNKIKT